MNFPINTQHRTDAIELMDDFTVKGTMLHSTLDTLTTINKWLGGNNVTLAGFKKVIQNHSKKERLTIVDLGCGSGDILRKAALFTRKEGYDAKFIGIDANEDALDYAAQLSLGFPEISYIPCNVFSSEFDALDYDVVLSTLFLHHFKEAEIIDLLASAQTKAKLGIVVNDLHRNPLAYYLFKIICLIIKNRMVIEDGQTSILRGFKREDLMRFSKKLHVKPQIKWRWAFRYQWIIQNS